MADPAGESKNEALKLDFDRRVMLRFHGSAITSDGGLLAYRELDDVLALTTSGGERLAEARTGRNRRHLLVGLLRQSVFGHGVIAGRSGSSTPKPLASARINATPEGIMHQQQHYVGLDVSLNTTSICVIDDKGTAVWRGKCASTLESITEEGHTYASAAVRGGRETGKLCN